MKPHIVGVAAVVDAALFAVACTWGTVREAETGDPIAGAEVGFIDSTGHEGKAVTGSNGVYAFDASRGEATPVPGPVTFEVYAPGYPTVVQERTITDEGLPQDFELLRCGASDAAIDFTHVPPYGSFELLEGRVQCVVPTDFKVAVSIKVRGGWWTKPYWDEPLTRVDPNGSWQCDITTGGIDEQATEIAAFLVPSGYSPPLMSGQRSLPAELRDDAVAEATAQRAPES